RPHRSRLSPYPTLFRSRAVRLERPDLHLAEALAAELGLAAQRLLRDERVRPRRARVDLVVDEVEQLEDVHVADGHLLLEGIAGRSEEHTSELQSPDHLV